MGRQWPCAVVCLCFGVFGLKKGGKKQRLDDGLSTEGDGN